MATGPSNSAVGDEADTDGVSLGLIVGASSGAKDEIGCGYALSPKSGGCKQHLARVRTPHLHCVILNAEWHGIRWCSRVLLEHK